MGRHPSEAAITAGRLLLPPPAADILGAWVHLEARGGGVGEDPPGTPAPDAPRRRPRAAEAVSVEARSEHATMAVRALLDVPRGTMRLQEPAHVQLVLTRALAEHVLSQINPFLSGAVAVDGGKVVTTVRPVSPGMRLPASSYEVQVSLFRAGREVG